MFMLELYVPLRECGRGLRHHHSFQCLHSLFEGAGQQQPLPSEHPLVVVLFEWPVGLCDALLKRQLLRICGVVFLYHG